jgi:inner membrane protein
VAVGLGWLSHVVLDYLSRDTSPPIGLLALWPICASYFKTPWPVFLDVGRSLDLATALHDLKAALWEAVLLGPALVLAARRVLRRQ